MIIVMQQTGAALKTSGTPNGILDLEFANSKAKAIAVLGIWKKTEPTDNIQAAKLNIELDFIFLLFYSIFLHQACTSVAGLYKGILRTIGLILANAAIAAGVLDISRAHRESNEWSVCEFKRREYPIDGPGDKPVGRRYGHHGRRCCGDLHPG